MTDINHRRRNKPPVNQRVDVNQFHNGYGAGQGEPGEDRRGRSQRVGNTDYLDKSLHGWGDRAPLSNRIVGASIGNDFCNGHRGMAKAVRGAKKFVRTRVRFHENAATKRIAQQGEE